MRFARSCATLLLFSLVHSAAAQEPVPVTEVGAPFFVEHFEPEEYPGYAQNWWVTQDTRGVIYVANVDGVLEYDGESWRLLPMPDKTVVLSLGAGLDGKVYVGTYGDFGFLAPDSTGMHRYVSLRHHVAPEDGNFAEVWATHATNGGTYFQTSTKLFRWDGAELRSWNSDTHFHTSFALENRFFAREKGVGLLEMMGDSLRLVPGGEQFAELRIFMMTPFDEERILIGTREKGFFLYDGQELMPFRTEADAFVRENRLYHGAALPGGFFALATLERGVAFIDRQGRLVQVLDQHAALPDGTINYVYPDAQGGLWLALHNKGIVRVDLPLQLSRFDRDHGLSGIVNDIVRHDGTLYVGTGVGLFYLELPALHRQGPVFRRVPEIDQTWDLHSAGDMLLAAADNGLFVVKQGRGDRVGEPTPVYTGIASSRTEDRFYVGKKDGLAVLERTPSGWSFRYSVPGTAGEEIRSIAEEEDGDLWLSTKTEEVFRLRFDRGLDALPSLQRFRGEHGLPDERVSLATVAGQPVFVGRSGVYRFHERGIDSQAQGLHFYPDSTLLRNPAAGDLRAFTEDEKGNIWTVYDDHVDVAWGGAEGAFVWQSPRGLRSLGEGHTVLFSEPNGVVWVSRNEKLVRYRPIGQEHETTFAPLIRRVTLPSKGEVVYGGSAPALLAGVGPVSEFDFGDNDLRFEFALPSFQAGGENAYQYRLEGHVEDWSAWTAETQVAYADLKEGPYRFLVRGRDGRGVVSREAGFAFRVLPPWYRTWWAYALYVIGVILAGFIAGHYRQIVLENRLAREQALELARERVVNERLQQANSRLEMANERLTQADRLKDELLANTSHELRTPITAILGFTSVLRDEMPEEHREFIDIIEASGHRLLHTVNSMLDFSRLQAGMLEVHPGQVAVDEVVEGVLQQLSPIAQEKELPVVFHRPEETLYAWVDRLCLERVCYNLVSNAVKFTESGRVEIHVGRRGDGVFLRVSDTGVGIDEAFLPYLFDAFKQESTGLARSHEGSGLGLAVSAQLVRLMEGQVEVKSRKGQGSVFEVTVPAVEPEGPVPFDSEAVQTA